jgi:ABC-type multidrug transport system ATPase subunit
VRALVRDLPRRREMTVFLSSHLLAEVEQVATHVAIISSGELKFEGTLENLRARSDEMIEIEVDQPERAQIVLRNAGHRSTREGGRLLVTPDAVRFDPANINALLVQAGVGVSHLAMRRSTLEDAFLELTVP